MTYPIFIPGAYLKGTIVQHPDSSLWVAAKDIGSAKALPSENAYWDAYIDPNFVPITLQSLKAEIDLLKIEVSKLKGGVIDPVIEPPESPIELPPPPIEPVEEPISGVTLIELENHLLLDNGLIYVYLNKSNKMLAPLQGFNEVQEISLQNDYWKHPDVYGTPAYPKSLSVDVVKETGKITVTHTYLFDKPKYIGSDAVNSIPENVAGEGYYKFITELGENEAALFTIETDYDIFFQIPLGEVTQFTYRGNSSTDISQGYEIINGVKVPYRPVHQRPEGIDAIVDVEDRIYRPMTLWGASAGAAVNSGFWYKFNNLGVFAGRASKIIWPGMVTPIASGGEMFLEIRTQRWDGAGNGSPVVRFEFGLTTGEFGIQNNLKEYPLIDFVPSFFTASIYRDISIPYILANFEKIKSIDHYFTDVMLRWKGEQPYSAFLNSLFTFRDELIQAWKFGDGFHGHKSGYITATDRMKQFIEQAACMFADPNYNGEKRDEVLKTLSLFCGVIVDEDFVPVNAKGVSFGTINMPVNFRAVLKFVKLLTGKSEGIYNELIEESNNIISDFGEAYGTPHYMEPTLQRVMLVGLQLRQATGQDIFNERWQKFASFYKTLLSPVSKKYGKRKIVSWDDSTEENNSTMGVLAEALHSDELYSIYEIKRTGSQFMTVALVLDFTDHVSPFTIQSKVYPGYFGHIRQDFGTDKEISIHTIAGSFYKDHRGNSTGHTTIYFDAPIVGHVNTMYNPHATHVGFKCMLIPETDFPEWNGAQPIQGGGFIWDDGVHNSLNEINITARKGDLIWNRKVILQGNVITFFDEVNKEGSYIFNLPIFSKGEVITPVGVMNPKGLTSMGEIQGAGSFFFNVWGNKVEVQSNAQSFALAEWTNYETSTPEKQEFELLHGRPYEENQHYLRLKGGRQQTTKLVFNIL